MGSETSALSSDHLAQRARGWVSPNGRAGPVEEPVVPPRGYLGVLADAGARLSLELLAERGPLAYGAHMRHVCTERYVSASTFERMHRELVRAGLVVCLPHDGDHRLRVDQLTPHARDLLRIAAEVEAVQRWAPAGLRAAGAPPLLETIADRRGWLIVRELFDGPFLYTDLSARLPNLGDGTISGLLESLTAGGLVCVEPGSKPDQHRYGLSDLVPMLARVVVLWARFRRQITPHRAPWLTGDLLSLIRLLERTSALCAPRKARGTVLLQVLKPPAQQRGWPEIEVALRHGRIAAHRLSPRTPGATVRALPLAWCDAALGELKGIEVEGDLALARTLLDAVSTALAACPRP